jgi:hypothetical protein
MRLAAELGYAPAMVKWAETLKAKDERAGSEGWFRKAADQGNRDAMFGLAGLLHRRHHPDAEQWYAAAANAGHPVAQEIRALGDQRPDEVADLKSAHAGDAAAMTRVGKRYAAMGDVDEADRWYQRGAEAGHRPASEALAESLERRGMKSAAESWRPTRS